MKKSTQAKSTQATKAPRCDRTEYLGWRDGVLMHFEAGRGFAVNEVDANAVDAALAAGRVAVLTEDGVPVTVLVPTDVGIVEHHLDEWLETEK